VPVQDNLTYTVTVTNNGPSDTAGFTVTDILPTGTSFVSATSPDCTNASGTVTCTSSAGLTNGTSVAWTITVAIASNAFPSITNAATVTPSTKDPYSANNTGSTTTAVIKRPTTLTYTGETTKQYSDVATLSARLTDTETLAPLSGRTVVFTIGLQSVSLQSVSAVTDSNGIATTATLVPPGLKITQPAGTTYTATASYDGSGISTTSGSVTSTTCATPGCDPVYASSSSTPATFTITREDALIQYSGDTLDPTSTVVTLAAVITEAQDGSIGGNLNLTILHFAVFKYSDTSMSSPVFWCDVPVTATGAAGSGTGAAKCPTLATSLPADNYVVQVSLDTNGYYTAPAVDAALTIYVPGTGFSTGGGWINDPNNVGFRDNFGFTVKYLKNGNIQGNSLFIYRVQTDLGLGYGLRDYNWIVKSNAMTALNQACTTTTPIVCTATFTGKSTVTAVDRLTGVAYSLGGNYQFEVDVTDNGEPGSKSAVIPDTYAVRVWTTTGGTYYQLGQPKAQVALNGGNIQVRP
jgi:uncharacterized repeat protein (TIGR01451 family)